MTDERAPSAWQIERAVSAYQQARAAFASNQHLIDDEQVILRTLEGDQVTPHPLRLLDQVLDAFVWAKLRIEEADALRASFVERRDHYKDRADDLAQLALDLLEICGEEKRRGRLARAHLGFSKPAVLITDEEALADRFVRIIREPNKTAIKEALDDGEVVNGAVLSNPMRTITITRLFKTGLPPSEDGDAPGPA